MSKNTNIPFALELVELTGFRLFNNATIELHPKLTVFIAPNSGGKTAVIDGVCYLLKAYATKEIPLFSEGDNHKHEKYLATFGCALWGRIKLNNIGMLLLENESHHIDLGIANNAGAVQQFLGNFSQQVKSEKPWKVKPENKQSFYASASAVSLRAQIDYVLGTEKANVLGVQDVTNLPLMACFTANRRVSLNPDSTFDNEFEYPKRSAFISLLPCDGLTEFDDWLRERAITGLEQRLELEERDDNSVPEPNYHLTAVSSVLAKMLSQEVDIIDVKYFSSSRSIQAVTRSGERIAVEQLSHGAKSILTIAAELAMSCCVLNPHLKEHAPAKTPGIVLIDEIDLHLHPRWQQHVLGDLQECFPCMQFIVTTHSPAVLTTVKKENIREINVNPENGNATVTMPASRSYGESSGDLQETIMGVSARPDNESVRRLQAYLDWAENGDLNEDKSAELVELVEDWGSSDHPDLLMAEMIIKRRQILMRNK